MHSQINRTATTFVCAGIEKLGTSHQQLENLATNCNMQPDRGCKPESPKILSEKVAGEVSGC